MTHDRPAEESGKIEVGDNVVRVNGKSMSGMDYAGQCNIMNPPYYSYYSNRAFREFARGPRCAAPVERGARYPVGVLSMQLHAALYIPADVRACAFLTPCHRILIEGVLDTIISAPRPVTIHFERPPRIGGGGGGGGGGGVSGGGAGAGGVTRVAHVDWDPQAAAVPAAENGGGAGGGSAGAAEPGGVPEE